MTDVRGIDQSHRCCRRRHSRCDHRGCRSLGTNRRWCGQSQPGVGGCSACRSGMRENSKGPSSRSGIRPRYIDVTSSAGIGKPASRGTGGAAAARSGVPRPEVVLASTRDPAVASPETQSSRRRVPRPSTIDTKGNQFLMTKVCTVMSIA